MWEDLTDEELDAETFAASVRIDAALATLQALLRERTRRATDREVGSYEG